MHRSLHRDPSYAYCRQGFIHCSRGLHGIEALYESISSQTGISKPKDDILRRFAGGLKELRLSQSCFSRVVEDFPHSIRCRDARIKLNRIERFNRITRRIISNVTTQQRHYQQRKDAL